MTATLQIEEGKFYRRYDSSVVGPARPIDIGSYRWHLGSVSADKYTADGYYHANKCSHELNLVAEAPNPAIEDDGFVTIAADPGVKSALAGKVSPAEAMQDLAAAEAVESGTAKRVFSTGASRDVDTTKLDFEGFLSPLALNAFAAYMHKNRTMADGSLRDSDNWQKGIPTDAYMKSMWRHFFDVWAHHRNAPITKESMTEALCGLLFNAMGYLHEQQKNDLSKPA